MHSLYESCQLRLSVSWSEFKDGGLIVFVAFKSMQYMFLARLMFCR